MDLETKKENGIIFLKPLCKNFDSTISSSFKERVVDLINQDNNYFILNLSLVDFIDSSGLGAIISVLKTLSVSNGNIVLCEAKNPILNLFKITRMNRVFQMYSNENEAKESLINSKKESNV